MKPPTGPRHASEQPERFVILEERRRPGRIENVSPELIPLLRGKAGVSEQRDPDDWSVAHGRKMRSNERALWIALAVTVLFWLVIAVVGQTHLFGHEERPAQAAPPVATPADKSTRTDLRL